MVQPDVQKQTSTELQRPDLGIETVDQGPRIIAEVDTFPWIGENTEVQTALVTLEDGTQLNYGSIIGANNTLAKLADGVSEQSSINAEQGLFKALPKILVGEQHPNIDRVSDPLSTVPLFKVSKVGRDAPRLFFAVLPSKEEGDAPTVLRVGIAGHKKQGALANIVTGWRKGSYGGDGRSR